jgi:hypothetical protein
MVIPARGRSHPDGARADSCPRVGAMPLVRAGVSSMVDFNRGVPVHLPSNAMFGARQNAPKGLSIRELPRAERPRERLKAHGAHASARGALAIVVGSGSAGVPPLRWVRRLLRQSESGIRATKRRTFASLKRSVPGSARAIAVHAALELGRRAAGEEREDGAPMRSPRDVFAVFSPRLEDLPVEEFHVAVLDSQHRVSSAHGSTRRTGRSGTSACCPSRRSGRSCPG